ncbi:PfkB family carbohydrate kinase [Desertihabitans aurantiacus]|uniref:PfkB family carbohydrate kinase n=1 Tax=Desertihabitans aurantiacus TaxID=2282477 RepID=UPI000DF7D35C|nr:PfkB family carbohydrate kinase [Desertihabitans aurantiacus]
MRFVVCGEALIDLASVPEPSDSSFRSTWQALSAGGPMNSAVALARLEQDVQFLGRMSTDRFGTQLRAHLEADGVGLDDAVTVDAPTAVAVVSLDAHGKASYAFHTERTATFGWRPGELPALGADDWLHFGSMLLVVEPGATTFLEWVRDCPARTSVDLNVRSAVVADPDEYWRRVEPYLAVVGRRGGVAKASDDDVLFLARAADAGADPSADPVALVTRWVQRFGLGLFVLTLGPDGALAVLADGTVVRVPGHRVEVEDTVGAGDTFMAGFLAAWAGADGDPEETVRAALRQGAAASAIVCGRQGAQPPTLTEVRALLDAAG